MSCRTYGQLDHREERARAYQGWLNCDQMLPGGVVLPPPSRADVPATLGLIRSTLPIMATLDTLLVDVGNDAEAIELLRAQLSPEENARVQFSTRGTP